MWKRQTRSFRAGKKFIIYEYTIGGVTHCDSTYYIKLRIIVGSVFGERVYF